VYYSLIVIDNKLLRRHCLYNTLKNIKKHWSLVVIEFFLLINNTFNLSYLH